MYKNNDTTNAMSEAQAIEEILMGEKT